MKRNLMAESRQAIPRMMAVATWHNITLDYSGPWITPVLGWGLAGGKHGGKMREAQFFTIQGNSWTRDDS